MLMTSPYPSPISPRNTNNDTKDEQIRLFEAMPDDQARTLALGWGIFEWKDRDDLNAQWRKFQENLISV